MPTVRNHLWVSWAGLPGQVITVHCADGSISDPVVQIIVWPGARSRAGDWPSSSAGASP